MPGTKDAEGNGSADGPSTPPNVGQRDGQDPRPSVASRSNVLRDFEREVMKRTSALDTSQSFAIQAIEHAFQVQLWKLPENIRNMSFHAYIKQLEEENDPVPLDVIMPPPQGPLHNQAGAKSAPRSASARGRKKIYTKNPYCTPLNKGAAPSSVIHPKVDPEGQVTLSRRPLVGEVLFSKHGSPVIADHPNDSSVQVRLNNGMVLTLPSGRNVAKHGVAAEGLDEGVKDGLASVKRQIDAIFSSR